MIPIDLPPRGWSRVIVHPFQSATRDPALLRHQVSFWRTDGYVFSICWDTPLAVFSAAAISKDLDDVMQQAQNFRDCACTRAAQCPPHARAEFWTPIPGFDYTRFSLLWPVVDFPADMIPVDAGAKLA